MMELYWGDGTAYVGGMWMLLLIAGWLYVGYFFVRMMPKGFFFWLWLVAWVVLVPYALFGGGK